MEFWLETWWLAINDFVFKISINHTDIELQNEHCIFYDSKSVQFTM